MPLFLVFGVLAIAMIGHSLYHKAIFPIILTIGLAINFFLPVILGFTGGFLGLIFLILLSISIMGYGAMDPTNTKWNKMLISGSGLLGFLAISMQFLGGRVELKMMILPGMILAIYVFLTILGMYKRREFGFMTLYNAFFALFLMGAVA